MLLLPRELLDAALTTETPQPIAALVEMPDWTWAHVVGGQRKTAALVLVLAGLQDPAIWARFCALPRHLAPMALSACPER